MKILKTMAKRRSKRPDAGAPARKPTTSVRSLLLRYGLSILSAAAAIGLALPLRPFLETSVHPLFLAAVAVAAWWGGLGPGVLTTVCVSVADHYFFAGATDRLAFGPAQLARITELSLPALLFTFVAAQRKKAGERLQVSQKKLSELMEGVSAFRLTEILGDPALRDQVTGLYSRGFMQESLKRDIARAARDKDPVAVIMFGLDRFSQINEDLGTEAGDMMLRQVGTIVQRGIRNSDVASRCAKDQFALVLPRMPYPLAVGRAAQLQATISKLDLQFQGQLLGSITVSLGVAAFPEHGTDAETVLRAADAALYQAKVWGRQEGTPLAQRLAEESYDPASSGRVVTA